MFADPEPLLPLFRRQQIPANLRDLSELTGSNHPVEFRQLLEQVSLISLRQTTGGNQYTAGPLLLQLAVCDDRVDRLLLGLFDETAGIDDDHFGFLWVSGQGKSVCDQGTQHDFRIDLVFRTTQVDETDRRLLAA